MIDTIEQSQSSHRPSRQDDRPGWIPEEIGSNWDRSPYAYQTEEELMPQGPLHDILNSIISEVLRPYLDKLGLNLWKDVFLLYRDRKGIKQRIAPDIMLDIPGNELMEVSWDLDQRPLPKIVGEITSPRSRADDYKKNRLLYQSMGIENYLVIDGLDKKGKETGFIKNSLWINGRKVKPDKDGFLTVTDLQVTVKEKSPELVFYDLVQRQPLLRQNEKDQVIEEKDRVIEEKDQALEEMDQALEEMDQALEEMDQALEEMDQVIKDNHQTLEEKDRALKEKDKLIQQLQKELGAAKDRN